ncbi:MAG: hypothetical protein ACRC2B_19020, partial [Rubrivivax sp.]
CFSRSVFFMLMFFACVVGNLIVSVARHCRICLPRVWAATDALAKLDAALTTPPSGEAPRLDEGMPKAAKTSVAGTPPRTRTLSSGGLLL